MRRAAAARDIPVVIFGHAGDGHVHVNLLPEGRRGRDGRTSVAGLLEEVTDAVVRLGGTPVGRARRRPAPGRTAPAGVRRGDRRTSSAELKRAFDPLGILGPGVILPSGEPAISRLKVGARPLPLPDDIARALREIEQTAAATPAAGWSWPER